MCAPRRELENTSGWRGGREKGVRLPLWLCSGGGGGTLVLFPLLVTIDDVAILPTERKGGLGLCGATEAIRGLTQLVLGSGRKSVGWGQPCRVWAERPGPP